MIQRTHIVPVEPMARRLVARGPAAVSDASRAWPILEEAGYLPDDIAAGLAAAQARAVVLLEAAASDRPWALALGYLRDLVAFIFLMGVGAYFLAVLP